MGMLEDALVKRIVETSPSYKRDVMEQTIRNLLGARELKEITGLPPRRGAADGGFDGIIDIFHFTQGNWISKRAGLNVKVRDSNFTREQLGCFLLDMDRESISVGIIITAAHLSPDAKYELERKNAEGSFYLVHIRISDILSGEIHANNILLGADDLNSVLINNIKIMIDKRD
ncbi:restriction endonuclease [Aeromonas salmonicida]|uniref:restriction endonuclease n=1 Tax=Aeromonas salmonicida TaxID=645 RepID=UPI0039A646EF